MEGAGDCRAGKNTAGSSALKCQKSPRSLTRPSSKYLRRMDLSFSDNEVITSSTPSPEFLDRL